MRWIAGILLLGVATWWVNASRLRAPSALPAADRPTGRRGSQIFAAGIVEGQQREVSLRFEIPGRVKSVFAAEGTRVQAGDVLAALETDLGELQVAEARARLEIALAERDQLSAQAARQARERSFAKRPALEQQLSDSEAALERGQKLYVQQAISRQAFDQARQNRDKAKSLLQQVQAQIDEPTTGLSPTQESIVSNQVLLAEIALRREQLALEKSRLRAPAAGVLLRATPQAGEMVGPTDEREHFALATPGRPRVRAYVEELDALRVSPGLAARAIASGQPEREHKGVVQFCSPHVRPKSHRHLHPGERLDVRVREVIIELEDGTGLLIGLPVEVFIEPRSGD